MLRTDMTDFEATVFLPVLSWRPSSPAESLLACSEMLTVRSRSETLTPRSRWGSAFKPLASKAFASASPSKRSSAFSRASCMSSILQRTTLPKASDVSCRAAANNRSTGLSTALSVAVGPGLEPRQFTGQEEAVGGGSKCACSLAGTRLPAGKGAAVTGDGGGIWNAGTSGTSRASVPGDSCLHVLPFGCLLAALPSRPLLQLDAEWCTAVGQASSASRSSDPAGAGIF
mmetsp:Transcript_86216/g.239050  ORF Transcript_86216/g.239050 Transcript_86216/m.239050 type:complete len:229 (+) Transcript_86216:2042-2728(+)